MFERGDSNCNKCRKCCQDDQGRGKKSLYEERLEDIDFSNTAKLRSRANKHQEEMQKNDPFQRTKGIIHLDCKGEDP